jgi:hypothetical protein
MIRTRSTITITLQAISAIGHRRSIKKKAITSGSNAKRDAQIASSAVHQVAA